MLYLITGTPGSGKSLKAVTWISSDPTFKGRPIYEHGFNELSADLGWLHLDDPKKWMDVPDGSVIVIDEAYQYFPTRGRGQKVPDYVDALARHRHRGLDIVVIGQHPQKQFDDFLLANVGQHKHLIRPFGASFANVYSGNSVIAVGNPAALKALDSSKWMFPKDGYKLYKSAEVHTHKFRLPKAVKWAVLLALCIVGAAAYFIYGLAHMADGPKKDAGTAAASAAKSAAVPASGQTKYANGHPDTAAGWAAASYIPEKDGVPWSAPRYAEFNIAVRAPIPRACILSPGTAKGLPKGCHCYTEFAERIQAEISACDDIVAGTFQLDMYQPAVDGMNGAPTLAQGRRKTMLDPQTGSVPGVSDPKAKPPADAPAAASESRFFGARQTPSPSTRGGYVGGG